MISFGSARAGEVGVGGCSCGWDGYVLLRRGGDTRFGGVRGETWRYIGFMMRLDSWCQASTVYGRDFGRDFGRDLRRLEMVMMLWVSRLG